MLNQKFNRYMDDIKDELARQQDMLEEKDKRIKDLRKKLAMAGDDGEKTRIQSQVADAESHFAEVVTKETDDQFQRVLEEGTTRRDQVKTLSDEVSALLLDSILRGAGAVLDKVLIKDAANSVAHRTGVFMKCMQEVFVSDQLPQAGNLLTKAVQQEEMAALQTRLMAERAQSINCIKLEMSN